jgi:hypothetical protein
MESAEVGMSCGPAVRPASLTPGSTMLRHSRRRDGQQSRQHRDCKNPPHGIDPILK